MDENQFWYSVWKGAFIIAGIATACISSCTAYESAIVLDMVKAGANPIAARCAISPGNSLAICSITAALAK